MSTTKRPVAELKVGLENTSKFFHQMAFKGIVLDNNPYNVDQLSLKNAKNVYIDENGTLVSRPPIVIDVLPPVYTVTNDITTPVALLSSGYVLVDYYDTGKIDIYVGRNNDGIHEIVAVRQEGSEFRRLSGIMKYHVSVIEQYIILFNDVDARVIDINNFDAGWQWLNSVCEIPVTKRVVGQESFTYPGNQFTEDYKEEYVLSDQVLMMLPGGMAQVEVSQSPSNIKWTLDNANVNTEFRALRSLNVNMSAGDIVTTAVNANTGINVLAIARPSHVLISLDYGQSFERVLYPVHAGFSNIASVSRDGLYFFFVARDGVYRYSIGDKDWIVIQHTSPATLDGVGINNACCFLNEEVFTFALYWAEESKTRVYWKGPNLADATYAENTLGRTEYFNQIYPNTKVTMAAKDCTTMDIIVEGTDPNLVTTVVAWLPGQYKSTSTIIALRGVLSAEMETYKVVIDREYGSILNSEIVGDEIVAECIVKHEGNWNAAKLTIGESGTPLVQYANVEPLDLIATNATDVGAPIDANSVYLINKSSHSPDGIANLPLELTNAVRSATVVFDRYFYTVLDGVMYSNKMVVADSAKLVYTTINNKPYTKIPTLSYTGADLYLAFDNVLMIAETTKDDGKLLLNLPVINNHSFSSNLNALVNVSTSEVAAFLINRVFIITKVADEIFGYRYDYLPTRLTAGVRRGDQVLNSANGMSTLYPTAQGLAVLNYQKDVSNTDQVSEYLSNNILAIWTEFYKAGPIKMTQMRDYLYLSNGTKSYLMIDMRTLSWWTFTSPFNITKIVTDQFDFKIVSIGLYKYDNDVTKYKDVGDRDIEWLVESQPNHFNAPVYYKNLKQLVFQLEESSVLDQTMAVQIKLYRKSLTIREPEIIGFSVDSHKTCIKRFNYWKINEMQWSLGSDPNSANAVQLRLNGVSVKYEISEEVRS